MIIYDEVPSGYRFTTYQDARRVRLVDGLETNILRVSPVNQVVTIIEGV